MCRPTPWLRHRPRTAAGNGRGQFAGRIGNILGFWLGDAGRSRTADLLIGGITGDNADSV